MRDLAAPLAALCASAEPIALALVVGSSGSTPRAVGAAMAVDAAGDVVGSLSGGCVEGAVYDLAQDVLATGVAVHETFGVSGDAYAPGLTCGGVLEVLVFRPEPALLAGLLDHIQVDEPAALVTVIAGSSSCGLQLVVDRSGVSGSLGDHGLDAAVIADARTMLTAGTTGVRHYGLQGQCDEQEVSVLVQAFAPPPRLLVFGATDFSSALAHLGRFLGYHVVVCDPRPTFTTPGRFPDAHEVVCAWPVTWFQEEVAAGRVDERCAIAVLTHDDRYDVPLIVAALGSPAGHVGAMGSRRTHESRVRRLREQGVDEQALARLHSPIGLDVGGRTVEETAVSIAAEMVLTRWGGTGMPLRTVQGDIHQVVSAPARATR